MSGEKGKKPIKRVKSVSKTINTTIDAKKPVKKPKNNIDIEIPGDYSEGIKRMVNTTIPIFSYSSHSDKLKSEFLIID